MSIQRVAIWSEWLWSCHCSLFFFTTTYIFTILDQLALTLKFFPINIHPVYHKEDTLCRIFHSIQTKWKYFEMYSVLPGWQYCITQPSECLQVQFWLNLRQCKIMFLCYCQKCFYGLYYNNIETLGNTDAKFRWRSV